jgi:hypothetical protein
LSTFIARYPRVNCKHFTFLLTTLTWQHHSGINQSFPVILLCCCCPCLGEGQDS